MFSKRIKELGNMIPNANRIIDVGCDHALLDIYLCQKFEKSKFLATDISANALEFAKKNILTNHLENRIEIKLTDGLENVELFPDDIIVISGMGTNTIIKILKSRLFEINNIIIQTNRDYEELRSFMFNQGFKIKNEKVVFDEHYYVFMQFEKGKQNYDKVDLWLGPVIRKSNNNEYFEHLLKKYRTIFKNMPEGKRKNEFDSRINILKSLIEKK